MKKEEKLYWKCSVVLSRNKTKIIKHIPPTQTNETTDTSPYITYIFSKYEDCAEKYRELIDNCISSLEDLKLNTNNRIDKLLFLRNKTIFENKS